MTIAGWTHDRLRSSRRPLHCSGCNQIIAAGEPLLVEERGRRYACSAVCADAVRMGDRPPLPPPRLPFGDDSQSDRDDPAF